MALFVDTSMRRAYNTHMASTIKKFTKADLTRTSWSVRQASAWSGIPLRTLYGMLADGLVPSVPVNPHHIPRAGARTRKCFRYVIPRAAFQRWFEAGALGSGNAA